MNPKSKLSADIKNLVLAKAHAYMKPVSNKSLRVVAHEDETKQLRKASEADKERKREKVRQKKKIKRDARERSKMKDVSEAKSLAINYLYLWNSARDMWTFKKKQQFWLLNNIFNVKNISEKNFQILINYLIDLKGEAKNRLKAQSENIIKKHEEKFADSTISAEDLIVFERARNILQILV